MTLRLACLQQNIVADNPSANYARVRQAFEGVEADMLVVPEAFNVGFGNNMASHAEPADGPTLAFAQEMAARHQALFVGTWCVEEEGRLYNRLHWVDASGAVGHYDKHHLFRLSSEIEHFTPGSDTPLMLHKGWRVRPAVCYDLRFPTFLRNKGLHYDMLLLCANWPASRRNAWTTLLQARAIENQCYVVGVNRCGGAYEGDTLILDYQGRVIASAQGAKEQIVCASLSLDPLQHYRQQWPFHLDAD